MDCQVGFSTVLSPVAISAFLAMSVTAPFVIGMYVTAVMFVVVLQVRFLLVRLLV